VTWSNTRHVATDAMTALADVSVELIDLRSLWPWDRDCVLTSAAKTEHLLVAHEAVRDGGFGAEVVATAVEEIPGLKVARLGAPRIPIPYAPPLEDTVRVTAENIAAAVTRLAG
ncbi:MAG: transketolase C-terminal domain-containing protein, partial [Pseudomonadota bacterium]|nr:transketolase C-terminal domain-containing protein [Pseudomonadota bacterium]